MAKQLTLPFDEQSKSSYGDIGSFVSNLAQRLPVYEGEADPFSLFAKLEAWCVQEKLERKVCIPRFDFFTKMVRGKCRHIGAPNRGMRMLHKLFLHFLEAACKRHSELRRFSRPPSATAFLPNSRPINNVFLHLHGQHFYIVDLKDAYGTVDTDLLSVLLVAILRYDEYAFDLKHFMDRLSFGVQDRELLSPVLEDPLFHRMRRFVNTFCQDSRGRGLIQGAPSSPFLVNLYYEATLDPALRRLCQKVPGAKYTRYVDDLVFSHSWRPFFSEVRKEIRQRIIASGAIINHRKSKFLDREKGIVPITGLGLGPENQLVFPAKKRKRLQGMLRTALSSRSWSINPDVLRGHVAHFLEYSSAKKQQSSTDRRLLRLIEQCYKF
jgi:hypothetical protein